MGYSAYFDGKFQVTPAICEQDYPEFFKWLNENEDYCDWVFEINNSTFEHNNIEGSRFPDQVEYLEKIIKLLKNKDYKLNGKVSYQSGDWSGIIWIENNQLKDISMEAIIENLTWEQIKQWNL